jgi:hypothetical protein
LIKSEEKEKKKRLVYKYHTGKSMDQGVKQEDIIKQTWLEERLEKKKKQLAAWTT